ncbi:bifunctional alpha/beta hydrolase/OsmC family protein [Geobacter pickeringii]|uniref:Osmotically inducible protein C n=1 Tax=Geobacter pickeringii TaxID=345632 RepID=A0A0B5BBT4_9BACT|nr:bifunctional alpha/beta hydrolase/OsmC family protein [Geobacter pickeringii]AJE03977.1 osmotically inducible protein C [Geobacter pickeringii]
MRTERITFSNAQGQRLAARLELPEGGPPLAYALFAHCFTCSKELTAAVQITRTLGSRRIAVLRFDFTGLGESEGEFAATTFSSEVSDLVAAARFLEREYQPPRLLIGHSLGGMAVLAAAAEIPSTQAIVTIAAPARPGQLRGLLGEDATRIEQKGEASVNIGGRAFIIRKSLLDDLEAQHPLEALRRLRVALLVMHSPRDRVVAIDNATAIYQAAFHPKSFISLDPADHLLSDGRDSRYAGEMIAAWAGRYLAPPESPVPSPHPPEAMDGRLTARTGTEGFRTDLSVSGFSLVADEPVEEGGGNQGPSPYDYLLAALGACTGMTLQMYARRKGWPLEEAVVRLSQEKIHAEDCRDCDEKDRRIDRFERELELRGQLDETQRQRLLEIAGHCPVHRTLTGEVQIVTTLRPDSPS